MILSVEKWPLFMGWTACSIPTFAWSALTALEKGKSPFVLGIEYVYRRILARDKQRKCLATGSEELSWLSVCALKWHFMTSLAKNMLVFSPFWALKCKTRFQHATKMKRIIGFIFRPIREEHQQQQSSPGSSVVRWVVLKLEKPSKIPIYKFISFEI